METFVNYVFPLCSLGMGILLLATTAFLYFNSRNLDNWQRTQGRILHSRIKRNGITYSPVVRFEYDVQGVEYQGLSINLNGKQSRKLEVVQEWIAPYPVGKEVDVYYNPDRPRMAVLEKKVSIGNWVMASFVGCLLIAIGLFYITIG